MPQALDGFSSMNGVATKVMKKPITGMDVPRVPEFLKMLIDLGAHTLYVDAPQPRIHGLKSREPALRRGNRPQVLQSVP
jgi:hypothetical protein